MSLLIHPEVEERLAHLELPFNSYGLDKYGISSEALGRFYSALAVLYRHYFRVEVHGIHNVPEDSRAMIVGNHSGGIPVDAAMVLASLFLDHDPPRHAHAMVEYFAQTLPFVSQIFNRIGQFAGLPEHAARFLRDDRLVIVFPEGARGTGKLYKDRYNLTRFGTGFMRLAISTGSPIVPFAFIGGEEAVPTMFHLKGLAKLLGVPYIPVPPQILPVPLPVKCSIHYGEPIFYEGDGNESDARIKGYVQEVKERIGGLVADGLRARDEA